MVDSVEGGEICDSWPKMLDNFWVIEKNYFLLCHAQCVKSILKLFQLTLLGQLKYGIFNNYDSFACSS